MHLKNKRTEEHSKIKFNCYSILFLHSELQDTNSIIFSINRKLNSLIFFKLRNLKFYFWKNNSHNLLKIKWASVLNSCWNVSENKKERKRILIKKNSVKKFWKKPLILFKKCHKIVGCYFYSVKSKKFLIF